MGLFRILAWLSLILAVDVIVLDLGFYLKCQQKYQMLIFSNVGSYISVVRIRHFFVVVPPHSSRSDQWSKTYYVYIYIYMILKYYNHFELCASHLIHFFFFFVGFS
jgi:hypothetical protein